MNASRTDGGEDTDDDDDDGTEGRARKRNRRRKMRQRRNGYRNDSDAVTMSQRLYSIFYWHCLA